MAAGTADRYSPEDARDFGLYELSESKIRLYKLYELYKLFHFYIINKTTTSINSEPNRIT